MAWFLAMPKCFSFTCLVQLPMCRITLLHTVHKYPVSVLKINSWTPEMDKDIRPIATKQTQTNILCLYLFHIQLSNYQILNVGAIMLPAQAIMDVLNVPPTISIVGESFSTEGTSCSTGAVSVLKHVAPNSCMRSDCQ